jgi:hypothetical protein
MKVLLTTIPLFVALAGQPQVGTVSGGEGLSEGDRARATEVAGPDEALRFDGSAGELTVPSPFVAGAGIDVDGVLDEAAWSSAAVLRGFTQYDPVEGAPASQETRVRVLLTEKAIIFGIEAFEDDPSQIRATLTQRDNITRSDDYVRLILDTFGAQREAFVFSVNPYGVQHDGLWTQGAGRGMGPPIDNSPNFLWDSEGRINADGWVAEVSIPLKSLRFPEREVQDWRIQVTRRIQRNGFEASWAPISANEANQLAQSGTLAGLQGLDPGMFLEFNPVLTGSRQGSLDDESGVFTHENPEAEFGFNLTYGLTSNLKLDGTYNPDFSQVEADAGQIVVNERFAIHLPERRPFFLEGTEIFNLPQNLVYTRSIVNPIAGAKITGKVGGFNIAYLGAMDEATSSDDNAHAYVNLVRARKDVGESSTIGLAYTDRAESSSVYNRVASADARFVLRRRYTLEMQGAGSMDGILGLDAASGALLHSKFSRSGRAFSFDLSLDNTTPDFRARSGFLRRVGIAEGKVGARYNFFGEPGALLERWGPRFDITGLWDHDDFWGGESWKESRASFTLSSSLRGNITFWGTASLKGFNYRPEAYEGLVTEGDGGEPVPFRPDQGMFQGLMGFSGNLHVSSWERVRGSLRGGWSETPIFDRATRAPVQTANQLTGNVDLTLYLSTHLSGALGLRHESLYRKEGGERYASATIPRVRAQYQFNKALFLRTIVEYGAQESGKLVDPVTGRELFYCGDEECLLRDGSASNNLSFELLGSYEPSPGTVFYLGYSRAMTDASAFGFDQITAQRDGLFAKLSYRFRF